jgi:hypothetical protein
MLRDARKSTRNRYPSAWEVRVGDVADSWRARVVLRPVNVVDVAISRADACGVQDGPAVGGVDARELAPDS